MFPLCQTSLKLHFLIWLKSLGLPFLQTAQCLPQKTLAFFSTSCGLSPRGRSQCWPFLWFQQLLPPWSKCNGLLKVFHLAMHTSLLLWTPSNWYTVRESIKHWLKVILTLTLSGMAADCRVGPFLQPHLYLPYCQADCVAHGWHMVSIYFQLGELPRPATWDWSLTVGQGTQDFHSTKWN